MCLANKTLSPLKVRIMEKLAWDFGATPVRTRLDILVLEHWRESIAVGSDREIAATTLLPCGSVGVSRHANLSRTVSGVSMDRQRALAHDRPADVRASV